MSDSYHRLFVSIPLERHFLKVFSKYRDAQSKLRYLRWVPERKLHVTALFIGLVKEQDIAVLAAQLREVARGADPFSLVLEKVQYAPPGRPASMVWGYFKESVILDGLVAAIHDAVGAVQTPADTYKNGRDRVLPHVTLAKFKDRVVRTLYDLPRCGIEGQELLVEELQLVRSRSVGDGTEYEVLEEFPLGEADPYAC